MPLTIERIYPVPVRNVKERVHALYQTISSKALLVTKRSGGVIRWRSQQQASRKQHVWTPLEDQQLIKAMKQLAPQEGQLSSLHQLFLRLCPDSIRTKEDMNRHIRYMVKKYSDSSLTPKSLITRGKLLSTFQQAALARVEEYRQKGPTHVVKKWDEDEDRGLIAAVSSLRAQELVTPGVIIKRYEAIYPDSPRKGEIIYKHIRGLISLWAPSQGTVFRHWSNRQLFNQLKLAVDRRWNRQKKSSNYSLGLVRHKQGTLGQKDALIERIAVERIMLERTVNLSDYSRDNPKALQLSRLFNQIFNISYP